MVVHDLMAIGRHLTKKVSGHPYQQNATKAVKTYYAKHVRGTRPVAELLDWSETSGHPVGAASSPTEQVLPSSSKTNSFRHALFLCNIGVVL